MNNKNILIMAGGTGGHIYPGLAIAEELRNNGFEIFWLGTKNKMETNIVPKYKYNLLQINIRGIRGKGIFRLFLAPFMLLFALIQTILIIKKIKPVLVIGMGGFVSGPGGIAAWLMRVPLFIHEQNSIAGMTNNLLFPFATYVMSAFPNTFKKTKKLMVIGNPVRKEIIAIEEPAKRFLKQNKNSFRVLVIGGSLGALRLNKIMPEVFSLLTHCDFEIKHQSGKENFKQLSKWYKDLNIEAEVLPYIDNMASAYAWANIAVCRAGALTISELTACGLGSILVPFPYAVDDHQTKNAKYLVDNEAAILLDEKNLEAKVIKNILADLYVSPNKVLDMATNAKLLAKPYSTDDIVKLCGDFIHV